MTVRVREALAESAARLTAGGIADGARDARRLVAHVAGIESARLTLHLDDRLDGLQAQRLEAALTARLARQPVSQIVGRRLFWGRWLAVTPDVLDPRPETETLVAEALREPFSRVLDLGTGSGAILLTLLAERRQASGIGIDISEPALAVARANAAAFELMARAALRLSDWFAAVEGRFDLIVSNPPYIAEDELEGLEPETRDWEPTIALSPGGDGLGAYRRIVAGAPAHLEPGGRLVVEIGPAQGAAVSAMMAAAGLVEIGVLRDLDGRDRVVRGRRAMDGTR